MYNVERITRNAGGTHNEERIKMVVRVILTEVWFFDIVFFFYREIAGFFFYDLNILLDIHVIISCYIFLRNNISFI